MAWRLSPIFTDNTALWPSTSSSGSSSSASVDELEMEIDSEQMTISQQCRRFERDMIWSPIGSPAPSSLGNCDMPTQQSSSSQFSVIAVESEDDQVVAARQSLIIQRECLMSPDMFADSQDSVQIRRPMEWRANLASSEGFMCGQKQLNDASMLEIMEFTEQGGSFNMQTGETIAAIAARINLLSNEDRNTKKVPMNKVLLETEDDINENVEHEPCSTIKKPDQVQQAEFNLSPEVLVQCKSKDRNSQLSCSEYEVQPTQEELTAFRKRLLQSSTPLECREKLSPTVKPRKILKTNHRRKLNTTQMSQIAEHDDSNVVIDNTVLENSTSSQLFPFQAIANYVPKIIPVVSKIPPKEVQLVETDENTFCSVIERTNEVKPGSTSKDLPSTDANPELNPQIIKRATSLATSSDHTFCSFAERQNTQQQQLDSEPFDIDAAIQNLMHHQEMSNPIRCEEPSLNDSGHATTPGGAMSELIESAAESIDGDDCVTTVLSQRSTYMSSIEKIVLQFLLDLVECKEDGRVTLTVQRTNWQSCVFEPLSQTLNFNQQNAQLARISSRHKIMLILDLLKEVYCRLKRRQRCTQRELYYNDPELYQDMRRVSSVLQIVSSMIGAMPWELGVFSTSCGLIAGPIAVALVSGEVIDCTDMSGGILLPHLTTGIQSVTTTADIVLLVEKDTVFQRLVTADLFKHLGKHCILLTGKGYPEINTRVMLHKIWSQCRLPMFVLCDADPHGIEIMLIYRHGSMQMSRCVDHLAVPEIQWIGLRPSDISRLGLQTLALSGRDERLIRNMLQRPYISEAICSELQILLQNERKAEIEALANLSPAYLVEKYLPNQILNFH